jgi:MFS family permease
LMIQGLFGMFFLGALFMQRVLDYGPIQVGLAFLPVAFAIGVLSLGVSARLTTKFGGRAVLLPGLVAIVIGLLWLSRAPVDARYEVDLLPAVLLLGIGAGLSFTPLMTLAMSGATDIDSGVVSGLVNTTQQVGGALGLAVLATLAASHTDSELAGGATTASALTSGYELAFVVAALITVGAILLTATVLRSQAPAAAREDEMVAKTAA